MLGRNYILEFILGVWNSFQKFSRLFQLQYTIGDYIILWSGPSLMWKSFPVYFFYSVCRGQMSMSKIYLFSVILIESNTETRPIWKFYINKRGVTLLESRITETLRSDDFLKG